jgi:hypothetical protein
VTSRADAAHFVFSVNHRVVVTGIQDDHFDLGISIKSLILDITQNRTRS